MNRIKNIVVNNDNLSPTEFFLSRNYPNLFNEKISIKYCVAYRTRVLLQILNIRGELKITLVDEEEDTGTYEFEFDPDLYNSFHGGKLRESIYISQLKSGDYSELIKIIYFLKTNNNFERGQGY